MTVLCVSDLCFLTLRYPSNAGVTWALAVWWR